LTGQVRKSFRRGHLDPSSVSAARTRRSSSRWRAHRRAFSGLARVVVAHYRDIAEPSVRQSPAGPSSKQLNVPLRRRKGFIPLQFLSLN
jgi:hypothetical protein